MAEILDGSASGASHIPVRLTLKEIDLIVLALTKRSRKKGHTQWPIPDLQARLMDVRNPSSVDRQHVCCAHFDPL